MRGKSVYLAGPITGLSYGEARHGWREYFASLMPEGVEVFSPMRAKDHLDGIASLEGSCEAYKSNAMSSPQGIVTRDRNDCLNSEVIVANFLGAEVASIGTCIEFGWADAARRPIIMVIEPDERGEGDNPHNHAMLNAIAGYRVDTLEEAANLCKWLLFGGV